MVYTVYLDLKQDVAAFIYIWTQNAWWIILRKTLILFFKANPTGPLQTSAADPNPALRTDAHMIRRSPRRRHRALCDHAQPQLQRATHLANSGQAGGLWRLLVGAQTSFFFSLNYVSSVVHVKYELGGNTCTWMCVVNSLIFGMSVSVLVCIQGIKCYHKSKHLFWFMLIS